MNKFIAFAVCIIFLPIIMQAQKNKKKSTKDIPLPQEAIYIRSIDTLLKPAAFATKIFYDGVQNAIDKIDNLDGELNNKVSNYSNKYTDEFITNKIILNAKHALIYIENETFDENPNANTNIKKPLFNQLKTNLLFFYKNLKKQTLPIDSFYNFINRFEDLVEATKYKKLNEFVAQNLDLSTYLNRDYFKNKDSLQSILNNSLCKSHPQLMGSSLKALEPYSNKCFVISYLASTASNEILKYAMSTSKEKEYLNTCNNANIVAINTIAKDANKPLNAIAFLGPYLRQELTLNQINNWTATDATYFSHIIDLYQTKETVSNNVIKRDVFLIANNYIRTLNELHNSSDIVRFKCLEELGAKELYYVLVNGDAEIYTSSFIGTYNRLMKKVKDGTELLELVKYDKFRTFIRMAANYNVLNAFLATMSSEQKNKVMKSFAQNLGSKKAVDLEAAVDVADSYGSITDEEIKTLIKITVEENYNKNNADGNEKATNLYKVLLAVCDGETELGNTINITNIPIENLKFDSSNIIYEQVFFYGDEDGIQGYNGFISGYKGSPAEWTVDLSAEYWVKITSKKGKQPFIIYANKALKEPDDEIAQLALLDYLIEKDIHPTIIVHRGHSYHLKNTLQTLNTENKIVIVGSCGGYQNLNTIIANAPDAHIISTKQVGKFKINQPIINAVNSSITKGENVDWVNIWQGLEKKFKGDPNEEDFKDYIPPYKNLGSLFLKTYNNLNKAKE